MSYNVVFFWGFGYHENTKVPKIKAPVPNTSKARLAVNSVLGVVLSQSLPCRYAISPVKSP